ncbi:MAG TPA: c-type cytochrome [Burkholderiales bacterium]|nr:c-type cytochrome [Burkholderiales bacterium]
MEAHDPHESFIKTPQQLIVVLLLSFLVPIIGILLLVQLVLSRPGADPQALTPESVAARIQPVAKLEFGSPAAAPGARSGEAIVQATCATCHQAGVAKAPKLGDKNDWAPHIKHGLNAMVQSVIKGKGAMPPKAGDASLTEDEIRRAVVHMANQAGANFKAPAAPKEKPAAAAAPAHQDHTKPAAAAAVDGKAVYDKVCFACHLQSVAGSPKLGDKTAWAPRIQTGTDAMVQSVIKGKGAMPPKAGNPALSDAEIRAAVEFMASQSK